MQKFISLAYKTIKFDRDFFGLVKTEKKSLSGALVIYLLISLASGIGSMGKIGFFGIFAGTIGTALRWAFLIYLIYIISKKYGAKEMQKNFFSFIKFYGFGTAPGIIRIFGVLPGFYWSVFFLSTLWMLGTTAFITNHLFEFKDIKKVFGICLACWVVTYLVARVIGISLLSF